MGWTFRAHAGLAAGLGAALLLLAGLTWLPGGPLPVVSGWPGAVAVLPLFPVFLAALVRLMLTGADRSSQWLAFRCLSGRLRLALGALLVAGVVVLVVNEAGAGNLQAAEERDGRYSVLDTPPHARERTEVSRSRYVAVLESDQRTLFALPGVLLVAAAHLVLVAGELRRAEPRR
ncbi:hypothetical protein [Streptomyces termitum]|uniref:hypothetical protein n=1 Tax=Streptomyces termitum TaxID=67368 RepID=UPI0033B1A468